MADESLIVDPGELVSTATRLDALADSLAAAHEAHATALTVEPSGSDEVSLYAARHFTAEAAAFAGPSADGVRELRKIAASLRAHADEFVRQEDDTALSFQSPVSVERGA